VESGGVGETAIESGRRVSEEGQEGQGRERRSLQGS